MNKRSTIRPHASKLFLTLLICLLTCQGWSQTILYVDSAATGTGDGSSWANAFTQLRSAMSAATTTLAAVDIQVAKGTYYPTGTQNSTQAQRAFGIHRNGLHLYGGYPTGGGSRDIANNPVYLDGNIGDPALAEDNSSHVMVIARGIVTDIIVDGFIFRNGNARVPDVYTYGGAEVMQSIGAALVLQNSRGQKILIQNCQFVNNWALQYGGAVAAIQSDVLFENCVFTNNSAGTGGGGFFQEGGNVTLSQSSFISNRAPYGGAIRNETNPVLSVKNSVFSGNTSNNTGAALSLAYGSDTLVNNVFIRNKDNSTVGGGAMCLFAGNFLVYNNTFYSDTTGGHGGAIRLEGSGGSTQLRNNIFYKCKGITGNDVHNDAGMPYTEMNNSFSTNPGFVSEASPVGADGEWGTADDGLQLNICSPAVNAGSTEDMEAGTETDITNQPRLLFDLIDLGAYERSRVFSVNEASSTLSLTNNCRSGDWANLYNSSGDKLIVSIKPGINNLGSISATSKLRTGYGSNSSAVMPAPFGKAGNFYPFNRSWNITTTNAPVDSVGVRFYFTAADSSDVKNMVSFSQLQDLVLYKVDGADAWNTAASGYAGYTYAAAASKTTYTLGSYQGLPYAEFYVTSFSAGSMAAVSSSSLPLDLLSFSGKMVNEKIKLQWLTSSEVDVAHFELERSTGNNTWIPVGRVAAKNTAGNQSYELWDNRSVSGTNYYRLKMVDIDGDFKYSKVVSVKLGTTSLVVYPNPSQGRFSVEVNNAGRRASLQLFDVNGRAVHRQQLSKGVNIVDVKWLPGGIYMLKIEDEGQGQMERLIITK